MKLHFSPVFSFHKFPFREAEKPRSEKCATADECEYDPARNVQQTLQKNGRAKRDVDPLINEIKKIIYCLRVLRVAVVVAVAITHLARSAFHFHPIKRQQQQHKKTS